MQRNNSQILQAWRAYHYEFDLNILPVGHEKIITLAFEAHTDQATRKKLAEVLQTTPQSVLETLRGYLKMPTFSTPIRELLAKVFPYYSEYGKNSIPSLAKVAGVRKSNDKNSYGHFYTERISDEIAEKLIETYSGMATGVALLLREADQIAVIDFDDKATLIEFLRQLGYDCDEVTLEDTLLRVFKENPIVATYRGYHIYCSDPDIIAAVKTIRKLGTIDIKVSNGYILLPPSLAGFEPQGATLNLVYYRQVRPLLPETIRAPLPTQIKDYLLSQINPQPIGFAPTTQQASPDLKTFIVENLSQYWRRGVRNYLTYTLAGVLRRSGKPIDLTLDIVSEICDRAKDEEKRDRLYQVRRQYLLPLKPDGKSPFCAGIPSFHDACREAGVPEQTYQILLSKIYGFKLTADIDSWLNDTKQLALKVAEFLRPTLVFNTKAMSWFVYDEDSMQWVEIKKEGVIHLIARALFEVRNDAEEVIRTLHNGSIPNDYIRKLNRLLNAQNIRNNLLETLAILLSVNFHFPHIPPEVAETLPAEVTRITGHRNGVLLWLENGDTIFYKINPNEPPPHQTFFVTQTNNSIVDDTADPTPFVEYVEEIVGDKETAKYLLEFMATVLGLRKNIFQRLLILLGRGRNGKTTFMQVVKAAFDKLVTFPTAKSILSNSNENNVMTIRANLEDCAFAVIDEAPPTEMWDLETMKYLTGAEVVMVRELYKNPKTIPVTWVHVILTNNYPRKFKQQDYATADRLVAIGFPNRYTDNVRVECKRVKRRDPAKIEKLKRDTPSIIQAFRLAFKEAAAKGFFLTEPKGVSQFTDPIRQRADTVGYFLDKHTIEDESKVVPADTLYTAYKKFVETNNLGRPLGKTAFDDYLVTSNFQKRKINGIVHFVGLKLKEDEQDLPTDDDSDGSKTSLLVSDNEVNAAVADNDGQDYRDLFPF
jgi:hypothetical protein